MVLRYCKLVLMQKREETKSNSDILNFNIQPDILQIGSCCGKNRLKER